MAKKQKNKGVTLIELLIVVLLLAALAAIAIPRISQSAYNAKAKACQTNIDIFNQAIERYYITNGFYPAPLSVIKRDINIFPDGPPGCPITGSRYSGMTDKRVITTDHNH